MARRPNGGQRCRVAGGLEGYYNYWIYYFSESDQAAAQNRKFELHNHII